MSKEQEVLDRLQTIIERLERSNQDFICSDCLRTIEALKELHDDIGLNLI